MNFWVRLALVSAVAFGLGFTLAKAEEPTFSLPDSDTSSLGEETPSDKVPFVIRCMTADKFQYALKKMDAKGLINGDDYVDRGLVMVFKSENNSLIFSRASKDGKTVCIFGATNEYALDIGVALTQRVPKEEGEKGDFKGINPEDQF